MAASQDGAPVGGRRQGRIGGRRTMPEAAQQLFTANGPAIIAEHRGGLLDVTPEQLGSIRHPTLIVGGKDSPPVFAETTNLLAAALPSARVEWVEGGHLIDPAHRAVLSFIHEVCRRTT